MDTPEVEMLDSHIQPLGEDGSLDRQIANIKAQVRSLRRRRSYLRSAIHASTINKPHSQEPPISTHTVSSYGSGNLQDPPASTEASAPEQTRHEEQCLYRLGAGATMFEVQDPDPYATDGGRVVGVRIEVCVRGKFLAPYYLLLNRSAPGSPSLRIHKHTMPPAIALPALAAKYLPQPTLHAPSSAMSHTHVAKPPPRQDLSGLVRALRCDLISHHLRYAFVGSIRAATNPGAKTDLGNDQDGHSVKEFSCVDGRGREIQIEWSDGTAGKIWIRKGGEIDDCVVFGKEGRERTVEMEICGDDGRIEGLSERINNIRRR